MSTGEEIDRLIRDLDNFQTRKAAKTVLLDMGEKCVDGLVAILESPIRDNVKWNIIDILSRIGSEKAVPVLRECAKNPTFESVCEEAVRKITGEELDPEPAQAEETTEEDDTEAEEPESKPEPEVKIVEKVIEKVVEAKPVPPSPGDVRKIIEDIITEEKYSDVKKIKSGGKETGYRFVITTDKGRRRQKISVSYDTTDEDGNPIICMYSICCEAAPPYFDKALRWNQNIANGSICVTDFKDKPYFVLLKHLPPEQADRDAILNLIRSLGERADTIEKVLTGVQDVR